MHIEPGLVDTTKIFLSYASAAAALGHATQLAWDMVRREGVVALLARALIATALVFAFFELLPHHPVGVSEVHLILGSTLFLPVHVPADRRDVRRAANDQVDRPDQVLPHRAPQPERDARPRAVEDDLRRLILDPVREDRDRRHEQRHQQEQQPNTSVTTLIPHP